jgi:hypothetical protein
MEADADGPWWLLAYRRAYFAIALPHTWHWLTECGLALVAPPEKHVIA